MLLERRMWSSKATTFRVTPFTTICPSFFFTIKGFGTIAMREIYLIIQGVWESNETLNHINLLLNNVPPKERESVSQDLKHIILSMYIDCLNIKEAGSTLAPHFNVYMDYTNFTYIKLWTKLRLFLQKCACTPPIEDQSKMVQIPFHCSCCMASTTQEAYAPSQTWRNGTARKERARRPSKGVRE